jgi:predicted esterase YcpF (UPF0227 family)
MKAQKMASWAADQAGLTFWCPQLPPSPAQAMQLVMAGVAQWPKAQMAVMGSSLGGFYATWVAEQTGCPAVLINPAVNPARDLANYIGEQTHWHDPAQSFFFQPEFVDELRLLEVRDLTAPPATRCGQPRVTRYLTGAKCKPATPPATCVWWRARTTR